MVHRFSFHTELGSEGWGWCVWEFGLLLWVEVRLITNGKGKIVDALSLDMFFTSDQLLTSVFGEH